MRVTYTVQSYDILRDISGGWLGIPPEPGYLMGDEYAMQKNRMKGCFFNWGVRADFQMKF
ncbi:MAG: hypothetical protein IJ544_05790 [Prevotella sp.]|nr:hypothetical protein [Prevotella sp.]